MRARLTGRPPQVVIDSGHPTSVVYAMDLTLLVPSLTLAAALLWRRRPWGYVLAAVLAVKCTTYTMALVGMGLFAARAGIAHAAVLTPIWAALSVTSLAAALALLANLRSPLVTS